jgi:hypothetical protein
MPDKNIPAEIVERDHALEKSATRANEALAKHRWHWTLDKSNPDRVSFSVYGRAVGRHHKRISEMANAWAIIAQDPTRDLQDEIQIQSVKQTDRGIVEAVAKATGTSVVATRQHHRDDVDRVRNQVAEAREQDDFTPEREQEVIEHTAQWINAERKARRVQETQRKRSTPLQVLVVEGDLVRARDQLRKTMADAQLLDLGALEEVFLESLRDAIARVVALAQLVQSLLGETPNVDWDAELAKIAGGE